ncbi:U4/U6-U5 snRNP complex subunit dib1 [Cryptotrichosporon argae]
MSSTDPIPTSADASRADAPAASAGAGAAPGPAGVSRAGSQSRPGFAPLTQVSSRLSQRSARADVAGLVTIDLARQETRTRRVRAGTIIRSPDPDIHEDHEHDHDPAHPGHGYGHRRGGGQGGGGGGGREEAGEEGKADGKYEILTGTGVDKNGDEHEIEVAVQITPDGTEIMFPDGGLEAYLVLLGGVCAAFCGFGMAASTGAFQTYYSTTLLPQYSSSTLSWIGSAQAAICFSTSVFTGPLHDLYGCKKLIAAGTLLLVLGFCMLSLCHEYYQVFLCHCTLIAMGMNFMFIVPISVVGQWFAIKRGMAFGIIMMGSSGGAIVWPVIMANLPQKIGFGWTCRLIALLLGGLGTGALVLLRTRLPPKPPGPFFHWAAFRGVAYSSVAVAFWFFTLAFFSFLTYIGTYGGLYDIGTLAPYLLTIANGSSGFGRVCSGLLADRIGTFNVVLLGNTVMLVLNFAWLACKTPASLIPMCIIYGFSSGAFVSMQGPMIVATADDIRLAGTLVGQALMVQSSAQLIGPPIFGQILGSGAAATQRARFPHAIVFAAVMLLVSIVAVAVARFKLQRPWRAIV